jgi:translation initiation factor IF-3
MQFKGREIYLKDNGMEKMNLVIKEAVDAGAILSSPLKFKGNTATAVLDTKKKK